MSNLTLTGGTDRAYTAGAKVEITPTARYAKDLYDWAMTGHNQNGTHKAFTESNIVPTAAIQDSAVEKAKLASASVDKTKVDFTTTGGVWWEELGRSTLGAAGTSMSVTITPKKFLKIIVTAEQAVSGAGNICYLRFNSDSGATQYARFLGVLAGTYSSATTDASGITAVTNNNGESITLEITGSGKALTTGSWNTFSGTIATTTDIRIGTFRWKGATDISNVSFTNTITNGFKTGSSLIVLGHD